MSEEMQYFTDQARERLELLGIAPGPKQPLDEKDAEIARLRSELSNVATCLYRTRWSDEKDDEYATALADHIMKQIGHDKPPQDTGDGAVLNKA